MWLARKLLFASGCPVPPLQLYVDVYATLMEASINDDVSQKQSHQRVHFQLWDACKKPWHAQVLQEASRAAFPQCINITSSSWVSNQLTQCNVKQQVMS